MTKVFKKKTKENFINVASWENSLKKQEFVEINNTRIDNVELIHECDNGQQ